MRTDPLSDAIVALLRGWGFQANRIAESANSMTPDILASFDGIKYLLEVKEKEERSVTQAAMADAFAAGELFEETEPMGVRNRIAAIARHAIEQIAAYGPGEGDLRLVWFLAQGRKADVHLSQIRSTLLGSTSIVDLQDHAWQMECYFFFQSVFFRFSDQLDGAVLSSPGSGQLILNPYSPRYLLLQNCALATRFQGGVLDPLALERNESVCIPPTEVDRASSSTVLASLQRRYGRPMLMNIELGYMAVWGGLDLDGHGDR